MISHNTKSYLIILVTFPSSSFLLHLPLRYFSKILRGNPGSKFWDFLPLGQNSETICGVCSMHVTIFVFIPDGANHFVRLLCYSPSITFSLLLYGNHFQTHLQSTNVMPTTTTILLFWHYRRQLFCHWYIIYGFWAFTTPTLIFTVFYYISRAVSIENRKNHFVYRFYCRFSPHFSLPLSFCRSPFLFDFSLNCNPICSVKNVRAASSRASHSHLAVLLLLVLLFCCNCYLISLVNFIQSKI